MENKSLISKQISIILWLLVAAIAGIETYAQFLERGFGNWRLYFFFAIFITGAVMYFRKKKERFENRN
jgi:hypothetical protein